MIALLRSSVTGWLGRPSSDTRPPFVVIGFGRGDGRRRYSVGAGVSVWIGIAHHAPILPLARGRGSTQFGVGRTTYARIFGEMSSNAGCPAGNLDTSIT